MLERVICLWGGGNKDVFILRSLEVLSSKRMPNIRRGFPDVSVVKNPYAKQESSRHGFDPWARKIPWRRK